MLTEKANLLVEQGLANDDDKMKIVIFQEEEIDELVFQEQEKVDAGLSKIFPENICFLKDEICVPAF